MQITASSQCWLVDSMEGIRSSAGGGPMFLLSDACWNLRSLLRICPLCHPLHGGLCSPGCHLPACTSEQEGGRERDGTHAMHSYVIGQPPVASQCEGYMWLYLCSFIDSTVVVYKENQLFIKRYWNNWLTIFKKLAFLSYTVPNSRRIRDLNFFKGRKM